MYISSIQQTNKNSIEFSLSTQTRRAIKSSQAKSLQLLYIIGERKYSILQTVGGK